MSEIYAKFEDKNRGYCRLSQDEVCGSNDEQKCDGIHFRDFSFCSFHALLRCSVREFQGGFSVRHPLRAYFRRLSASCARSFSIRAGSPLQASTLRWY
jgi:hypothetical protein